MARLNTLIYKIIFVAAILLPPLYVISLIYGFYFSGDTISFLQFGTGAGKFKLWDVFIIHGNQWPPLPAIFYNLLQFLPGGFIAEQKAYLLIFFFVNLFACYFLVKRYSNSFAERVIVTSLILFSSSQILLLRVSLADVQFMATWILALVFLDYFIQTKKEKYVALFIIPAGLIPLTRYAGIIVTLSLSCFLFIFSIINHKVRKFSIYFIASAVIFTLIPISFYLFRNFVLTRELTGFYDPQFESVKLSGIFLDRVELIINDIALPFLVALIFGTRIVWRKDYSIRIILFSFSILTYLSVIIIQQLRYRVTEFIPSRYNSPFYPVLMLIGLLIGSWLAAKYINFKRIPKIFVLLLTLFFFGLIYNTSLNQFISELGFSSYRIPEAAYSNDIQQFCNTLPDKKRYLFLQYDSRNWVAQSLYFFCRPIDWITMTSEKVTLPKDSLIFSPYELTITGLKKIKTYYGRKNINLYLVELDTELNIKKEITKLSSILE